MRASNRVPLIFAVMLLPLTAALAQRNNPFSANPDVRTPVAAVKREEPQQVDIPQAVKSHETSPAEKKPDLTQIYRVGPRDTLFIALANAPNASGYYSVRQDGTIDFPLAGDSPRVQGLTTLEIEQQLSAQIKLYRDAQVTVKVREFGSHKIHVSGLVERNGERFLQRDAMPLFTVKADVGVKVDAVRVVIKRSSGATETYSLADVRTDSVLVSAGDVVEFGK